VIRRLASLLLSLLAVVTPVFAQSKPLTPFTFRRPI